MHNDHLRRIKPSGGGRQDLVLLYTSPVSRQEQQEMQLINWVCIWQETHVCAGNERGLASNTPHKGNKTMWKWEQGASPASHWNPEHSQLWGHHSNTPGGKQVVVQSKPGCSRLSQGPARSTSTLSSRDKALRDAAKVKETQGDLPSNCWPHKFLYSTDLFLHSH